MMSVSFNILACEKISAFCPLSLSLAEKVIFSVALETTY